MKDNKSKLSLDRPVTYQIKVPGLIREPWVNINAELSISVENNEVGLPISTLTVAVDQAGLHGLLSRLYTLGLPLISVICVEVS
jgi:hypothetical protein